MGQKGRLLNIGILKFYERCLIYNVENLQVDFGSEMVGFMMINFLYGF